MAVGRSVEARSILVEVDVKEEDQAKEAGFFSKLSEDLKSGIRAVVASGRPEYPEFEQLPDPLKYGWGLINLQARAAGSPFNWSFTGTATPQQSEPMPVPRGKVLGGSSAINGQGRSA